MTPDVLAQLSEAAWRGIQFPLTSRNWDFSQENARHRILFQRDQLIESLGGENPMYQYTAPFREGTKPGLFIDVYPQFLEACLDESDGILDDPIHGPVQVKCATIREVVDPDKRDGIDVEVGFVKSPDEDFTREDLGANIKSIRGARDVASSLDGDIQKIDWKQEPQPEPMASGFDIITSVTDQLAFAASRPIAAIDFQLYRLQAAEDSIERLADPRNSPAQQKIRALRLALIDERGGFLASTARSLTGGGSKAIVRQYVVPNDIGVISLASKLGMSLDDFLRLNAQIRGQTLISAGTLVFYIQK